MVKRKANISVDEWLERGRAISEATPTAAATAGHETVESSQQSAEVAAATGAGEQVAPPTQQSAEVAAATGTGEQVAPPTKEVEQIPATTTDLAEPVEGTADWFWALLAQTGYETW